ncbi:hypothetical protein P8C59_005361 [Phyllachora maydis]|uniref:Amine oxidase domain-containing protein n=1 Tax=Phyllachora maydis TaxID=1825666 RepID=A0AAD9I5B6_9PEZI|nr:hypothetical protein P8C59_005361 [Phyllachora maydis]
MGDDSSVSHPHDVYLYEAAGRLGGHVNTVEWTKDNKKTMVDTGFIVMNAATYPNLIKFLDKVQVKTVATDMTFSVSRDDGVFEWAGSSLSSLFCQGSNLFSPRMWRMIFDIIRFNQYALDLLKDRDDGKASDEETIGAYLERQGYSDAFRDDYLIPMTAAVWSTSPDKCSLQFPAVTLIRFLYNHHLLTTVAKRPEWLTIPGGSQQYIDMIMKGFPANHLFLNTPVKSVTNGDQGHVVVHLEGDKSEIYDHVILAVHGDQAYSIIRESATQEETEILSCFQTSKNTAVLHSDLAHMPRRKAAWSSWNYLSRSSEETQTGQIDQVSLTYNMNMLQHIPHKTYGDVLVTLNPLKDPDPATVQGRFTYEHPLYTSAAVRAQSLLPRIQNRRGISYAGAWTKYGFHEDSFSSGLVAAVEHLGAKVPFPIEDSTYSRRRRPEPSLGDRVVRLWVLTVQTLFVGLVDGIQHWTGGGSDKLRRVPQNHGYGNGAAINGKEKQQ